MVNFNSTFVVPLPGFHFDRKEDLFKWRGTKLKVGIIHKGSAILMMKTAGSKNCNLFMQERTNLFYNLGDRDRCRTLINSKSELFGACTYKARFLRLCAVGNAGADKATSR